MDEVVAPADLRLEHFEPLVGQEFIVQLDDGAEVLVLAEVQGYFGEPSRKRQPFALRFRGTTPGLMLHQRIQRIAHPALGEHEWFLVPLDRGPDNLFVYEANFS